MKYSVLCSNNVLLEFRFKFVFVVEVDSRVEKVYRFVRVLIVEFDCWVEMMRPYCENVINVSNPLKWNKPIRCI